MRDEIGHALPLALVVLAMGTLVIFPSLNRASVIIAGSQNYERAIIEQYSCDAGIEHAIWRLKYQSGFIDSFTYENPTVGYSVAVNSMTEDITITRTEAEPPPDPVPPPEGPQSERFQVAKSVEPESAPVGQPTTFTYTIYIENVGTSEIHLAEVRDWLPPNFVYEIGTSSGVTTAEPTETWVFDEVIEQWKWELVWDFSPPLPSVAAEETVTQVFQATGTLDEDIYWNTAWVSASPDSVGEIGSGSSAPIGGGIPPYVYDITSAVGGTTISACVMITDTGVSVRSWQIE
ncbi:hypothetical protein ACFLWV_04095 [Chloroflexota bacterium]